MRVRFFRPLLTSTPVLISLIMVAVCGNLHAQNPAPAANVIEDYSLLTKPEIAAAAKLTEDQSAAVKQLITERDAAVAAAEESSRPAIMAESNEKLKAVLTSDQQRLFVSLFVGKTLRFNFRNQKWTDVLAWISKEADLSLVMETPPPGTFTYADSKDYSTIEAIDLLNGWLLTKGFTLVRRERMLMCLNLKGGLPEGTIPRITLAELATRGRYEFVSVLIPLDGRPPEAVLLEVKPLLGSYGNAEPLAQTQQLLVSDTAANLRIIEQIVQKIPIPQKPATPPAVEPPKPVLTVYPIEHANPVQAGEVLKQIIAGTVVVDEKALQISVNAIPTEQDKAKTIIAQLESNQGPDKQPKLQLYSVTVSDADQMLATVKLIAPDGQYRIDAVSGKLIAWANENDQAHIAESLQMIQADQPQLGGRQLQVYALKNAEPGAVSTILATVVPGARITVNSATRSLIAFGSLADHESIRALIEQLETQTNSAATEKVLVTYPASAANSSTIVTLLATVVPQAQVISDTAHQRLLIMATADEHARVELLLQSMAVAETDGKRLQVHDANHIDTSSVSALLATLTPQAAVTIDAINKRLLVVASEQDQARVTDVLTQVRTTDAESNRALKSYPLQPKTNSSTIVTLLASLVPRAAATIDDVNRRLLITATEDEHTLIDQVIQQVQKDAVGVQPELRFYPLTKVSGPTSLTILQSIAPQATITFQADANRYSVIATTNDHDAIAATLEKMETASQDLQRDLKFYDVGTIGGADTRTLLASTYTDVTFVANADGSKLMAWVSPMQDEKIQATLEQLLTERPFQANRTMELYSITDLGPSASTVLSQAVPNSTISAGARADQLAIVATAADHEKLRGILEQLQRTKVSRELKFYPLQNVPGPTSLTILQSIAPQATITFQADGNRYSVIATANEHDAIAATLEKMETRSDDVQRDLKFYDVGTIGAADTRTLLASTFADVTFVPTAEGNKLMAWVSPGQDERIQATLKQLAVEKPFQATRTMQLYSIRDLGPTASTVLSQAVPTATITVGARSDQLAIVATAADHEKLAKVLQQLEATKSFPPRKSLVIHQIKGVTPQSVLQVLQPLVDGEVQLTIDPAGQQLFVRAFPDKQGDITAVINQITEQLTENGVRSTKTYIVGAPNADEAQEVLAALFPDAKIVSDADRKMIIATATPDQHATIEQVTAQMKGATLDGDQPVPAVYSLNSASATEVQTLIQSMYNRFDNVRLSINEKTGRLVVLARPDQHEAIRPLIEQLDNDSATATDLELAVFRLNQLDVQAVQQALEPLLPRNAQVTSDRSARQLLVSASKGDMPAIREMVQQMISTQGTSEGLETRSYRLRRNEADEAQEVLEKLLPDATLVTDVSQEVLVATATPEQHETIASVVQQMTNVAPDVNSPKAIAYPLKAADGANAVLVFQALFTRADDVRLSFDEKTRSLIAVARPDQHEAIKGLIEQLDGGYEAATDLELAVFRLNQLDGLAIQQALQPLLPLNAQATADRTGHQLLVSASKRDMPALREMVQQMISSQGATEGLETRSYRLRPNEANAAQEALAKLFPDATLVTDASREILVATATPQQHESISSVVQQMTNAAPDANSPQAIAYPLKAADGANAVQVFEALFTRADDVRLSFDEKTRSLIAVARPDQHKAIKGLIDQLESGPGDVSGRTLEIYPLPTVDGLTAVEVAEGVLQSIDPSATVTWEKTSKQLIVSTTASGHLEVSSAVKRFQESDPREMDVIQLRMLSASSAQNAIEGLYGDSFAKSGDYPIIQADEDSQQLLLRGSKKQLQDIRVLLVKMGETGLSITGEGGDSTNRNLRVIPVHGDVEPTLKKIQDLWPQVRRNPIRVLRPDAVSQPIEPKVEGGGQFAIPAETLQNDDAIETDEPAPETEIVTPAADEPPPVIIIPGSGRITIASDDTDALDQLEAILRATSSSGGNALNRNRDFSIYQLRNAGAEEVSETLKAIYQNRAGTLAFGSVIIVPEPRMNALIVYGGRTDRDRIEQLLEILDTEQLPDSGRIFRTHVIPLTHADAKKVEIVLKGVYRSEMTAGGSRRAIDIPTGIDSTVANMLRQINAAASAPLLTIEVQVETNSLVVKAPQNLIEELSELVSQLDETSATNRARGVTLIPLKQTNTRRVMRILGDVLD